MSASWLSIVLAVLPLFIEADKESITAVHEAASRSASDEKLQEFYEKFSWETFELKRQIEKIIRDLLGLPEGRKTEILKTEDVKHWNKAADVAEALTDYFVSQDDYLVFRKVMEKVLDLLSRVVEDKTVRISRDEKNRVELVKICEIGPNVQRANCCLQLLIEDLESSQRIWQLNWQQAQLAYLETKPATTFQMMLQTYHTPSLIERRRLALIFAHSLFQLHESPWLSEHWAKDRIHFFYNSMGNLDLHRPYLSTSFDDFPLSGEPTDLNRFHRNLGILRLGILLIEVHKWKPLESFRVKDDLCNGTPTPNTDMEVARRVQETLDNCFPTYRDVIESCLKVPWVSGGLRVSLEDPETWNGVYTDVIQPLERELALGAVVR
ncbi:hypothetical protein QQZ08_012458 [Neonectria magnoliae]|uniref:DUF7580 domain-containing protein n=1 Tax=Neonectria magnoliae TaxID=2732573 RepID=A0ABR1H1R4_9HYPO